MDLRYTSKSGSHRHINLLEVLRRIRPGDDKIRQSGGFRAKGDCSAAFSMLFITVLYLRTDVRANLRDRSNLKAVGRIEVSTLSLGPGLFWALALLSVRLLEGHEIHNSTSPAPKI